MTKEEYENLKVGDIVVEYSEDAEELCKLEVIAPANGDNDYPVDVIESKSCNYEIGDLYWLFQDCHSLYELHNGKPKKLYKPWG